MILIVSVMVMVAVGNSSIDDAVIRNGGGMMVDKGRWRGRGKGRARIGK